MVDITDTYKHRGVHEERFVCRFCHKVFVLEDRYLAHECKQMKRQSEIQTPLGQTALGYYQTWMRRQRRLPPPASSFLTSKYYRTFINFAQFVKNVSLPNPDKFIWLMVERKMPPTLWTNDEIYTSYIEFLDHKVPPMEQVSMSIQTLLAYADKREIDIADVFEHLEPMDIIHMVRVRKLSPWLLLFSKKFKQMFKERLTPEQKIILETLIRPDFWAKRFEDHPNIIEKVKECVEELHL